MDAMATLQIVLSIVSGIATAIPLMIKLVSTINTAAKEKNWNQLMKMTLDYMAQAESNIASGADRKQWVISMVRASASTIDYPMTDTDVQKIESLIDTMCTASKTINATTFESMA